MKIYTKIIFDMTKESLPVIEEESFEYEGPIAKCWTSGTTEQLTQASTSLKALGIGEEGGFGARILKGLDTQIGLSEAKDFQEGYRDWQLRQLGYQVNPQTGKWEAIPYEELSSSQQLSTDIERLRGERTFAALEGDLPVSKGLERNLLKGLEATKLAIARGPGETSTPGIQKLGQAELNAELIRESVRTGQITEGYANFLQQQQVTGGLQNQFYQNVLQGQSVTGGLDLGYAQLASQDRRQADANRTGLTQARFGLAGDIIGGVGTVAGAYYGAGG